MSTSETFSADSVIKQKEMVDFEIISIISIKRLGPFSWLILRSLFFCVVGNQAQGMFSQGDLIIELYDENDQVLPRMISSISFPTLSCMNSSISFPTLSCTNSSMSFPTLSCMNRSMLFPHMVLPCSFLPWSIHVFWLIPIAIKKQYFYKRSRRHHHHRHQQQQQEQRHQQ